MTGIRVEGRLRDNVVNLLGLLAGGRFSAGQELVHGGHFRGQFFRGTGLGGQRLADLLLAVLRMGLLHHLATSVLIQVN